MIKHKEMSDPTSCLNKAKHEEPLFVLRANDPCAIQVVEYWAFIAQKVHEKKKIEGALRVAEQMECWLEGVEYIQPTTIIIDDPQEDKA